MSRTRVRGPRRSDLSWGIGPFTEEVDPQTANTTITIDGAQTGWDLQEDRYTLRSILGVSPLSHTVQVLPGIEDVAGLANTETRTVDFPASAADRIGYYRPDPSEVETSTASNRYGFHGLELDQATGLIYMRNRWYDPELGRFITADPLGYVDGGNRYSFAGGAPTIGSDPLGLYQTDFHYYVVFYVSYLALGDFERAHRIAFSSQYVDDYFSSQPAPRWYHFSDIWGNPPYYETLQAFHFVSAQGEGLQSAPANPALQWLGGRVLEGSGSQIERDVRLGVYLHSVADSFSHSGFTGFFDEANDRLGWNSACEVGHCEAGTDPDEPFLRPRLAAEAGLQVYRVLRRFFGPQIRKIDERALVKELVGRFSVISSEDLGERIREWSSYIEGRIGLRPPWYDPLNRPSVPFNPAIFTFEQFDDLFERAVKNQRALVGWYFTQRKGSTK